MNEYGKLCTECYDALYKHAPQDELRLYLSYIENTQGSILEPMCGAGRFLIPIAKRGYCIYGFDHSASMIEVCKDKLRLNNLPSNIQQASLDNFSYNFMFDVIFITSGSFGLITDPQQARQCLDRIYTHLDVNGIFLVEIETPLINKTQQQTIQKTEITKSKEEHLLIQRIESYDNNTNLYQSEVLFQRILNNDISESEKMEFDVQHYKPTEFENILQCAKFKDITPIRYDTLFYPPNIKSSTIIYKCTKT